MEQEIKKHLGRQKIAGVIVVICVSLIIILQIIKILTIGSTEWYWFLMPIMALAVLVWGTLIRRKVKKQLHNRT